MCLWVCVCVDRICMCWWLDDMYVCVWQDPYVTRPLPCLIGSPMFLQDDNVGLMEDVSGRIVDKID